MGNKNMGEIYSAEPQAFRTPAALCTRTVGALHRDRWRLFTRWADPGQGQLMKRIWQGDEVTSPSVPEDSPLDRLLTSSPTAS
jgi:hypothetical protein